MYKGGFQMAWALILLPVFAIAQAGPRVTGVEPTTCRVGDTLTVMGENLAGSSVEELMFSNEEENHPAEIVERTAEKMIVKVPVLEPGTYRLALKIQSVIYTEPVQVTVE